MHIMVKFCPPTRSSKVHLFVFSEGSACYFALQLAVASGLTNLTFYTLQYLLQHLNRVTKDKDVHLIISDMRHIMFF